MIFSVYFMARINKSRLLFLGDNALVAAEYLHLQQLLISAGSVRFGSVRLGSETERADDRD